jgi:hypothetical protein
VQSHSRATSPPPSQFQHAPQHEQPSDASGHAAHGSRQRPVAPSVHNASTVFDPLNLFGSGRASSHADTSHSSFPSTLEEELYHFKQMHTRSRSDTAFHHSSHLDGRSPSQSPLDVGFWGSIAQHFSPSRTGFLQATIDRHNLCMQNATQHVVELVSGVGGRVGFSPTFPRRHTQHNSPAVPDDLQVHTTAAFHTAQHTHSDGETATATAPLRFADAVSAKQEESGGAAGGDSEERGHGEASYSQPRFVATEERRSAVRAQLVGLRRKARLHAQG